MIISTTRLAYLAGLIDGEGSIQIIHVRGVRGGHYRLTVSVMMCDHDPVLAFAEAAGVFVKFRRVTSTRRLAFYAQVCDARAADFLRVIQPYVIGKRDQISVALEFHAERALPRSQVRTKNLGTRRHFSKLTGVTVEQPILGLSDEARARQEACYARLRAIHNRK